MSPKGDAQTGFKCFWLDVVSSLDFLHVTRVALVTTIGTARDCLWRNQKHTESKNQVSATLQNILLYNLRWNRNVFCMAANKNKIGNFASNNMFSSRASRHILLNSFCVVPGFITWSLQPCWIRCFGHLGIHNSLGHLEHKSFAPECWDLILCVTCRFSLSVSVRFFLIAEGKRNSKQALSVKSQVQRFTRLAKRFIWRMWNASLCTHCKEQLSNERSFSLRWCCQTFPAGTEHWKFSCVSFWGKLLLARSPWRGWSSCPLPFGKLHPEQILCESGARKTNW